MDVTVKTENNSEEEEKGALQAGNILMVAECDRGSRDAYLLLPTSLPDNDGRAVGKTTACFGLACFCCHFSANVLPSNRGNWAQGGPLKETGNPSSSYLPAKKVETEASSIIIM
eukprot:scaffold12463_cov110-Skeletonema_marinoi.AAC.3